MTPEQLAACWKHGDALAKKRDPDGGMIKELVAEVGLMRESLRDRFAMAALAAYAYSLAAHMLTARAKATGGLRGDHRRFRSSDCLRRAGSLAGGLRTWQ